MSTAFPVARNRAPKCTTVNTASSLAAKVKGLNSSTSMVDP